MYLIFSGSRWIFYITKSLVRNSSQWINLPGINFFVCQNFSNKLFIWQDPFTTVIIVTSILFIHFIFNIYFACFPNLLRVLFTTILIFYVSKVLLPTVSWHLQGWENLPCLYRIEDSAKSKLGKSIKSIRLVIPWRQVPKTK